MRGLERRVARLESVNHKMEEGLVSPETFARMAAVYETECARIREKLMGDGPHVPATYRPGVESEAGRRLREKLLRPNARAAAEPSRP